MTTLIQQAIDLAQGGLHVFPVRANKTPACKNGHRDATRDPERIAELFDTRSAAGIGVWLKASGLCAFDVDTIAPGSQKWDAKVKAGRPVEKLEETNARLNKWIDDNWDALETTRAHTTQNGGWHFIFRYPENGKPLPTDIIGEVLSLKWDGYIVWSGTGYEVEHDVKPAALPPGLAKVIEKRLSESGPSYDDEFARLVMDSDGELGERHTAINRLAIGFARDNGHMSPPEMAEAFVEWLQQEFPGVGSDRPSMFEWRWDERDRKLQGELGRSLQGAIDKYAGGPLPDHIVDQVLTKAAQKGMTRLTKGPVAESKQYTEPPKAIAERLVGEFTDLDLNVVLAEEIPDVDWIVDDLIPSGNLISVSGPSGAGKTRFNAMLMAALSTGETDKVGLPKASRPVRSLYIANEERTEDVKRRLKAAAKLNGLTGNMLITVRGKEHGRFHLIGPDGEVIQPVVDKLVEVIRDREIEVVMIDPIVTIGIEEENAAAQVDTAMGALQNVASATGACVLFVHHSPKGEKSAPDDALRGDSGAWRGSGVFYSSLDIGLTLMPWLPDECHEKNNGAANRRRWKAMVRNRQAPKYVVLDSAKERENEGLQSVIYEIMGQEVRVGGRKIGAMRPVSEAEARLRASHLLSAVDIDEVVAHEVARTLLGEWPKSRSVTLTEAVEILNEKQPAGWQPSSDDEKIRADRGTGKLLLELLAGPVAVGNRHVSLAFKDRRALWQVL